MPMNGENKTLFHGMNGIPYFTYIMLGVTTAVLSVVTLLDSDDVSKFTESGAESPTQEEASQEEPPQEEAPQEEAPQEEPPQEEPPQEEAPQEEAPQEEPPQEEAPQEEAPQEEAPQEEQQPTTGGKKHKKHRTPSRKSAQKHKSRRRRV